MRRLYFSPALLWSLVGLGAVLRLYWFLFDRALWFDEASVALDILYKSIPSLLRELHPVQPGPAPIGYLLASRAATVLFSDGERALRLVPLVCGLASLALFLAVARQYCAAAVVPIALALFAISPSQIYFSAECKPYATDVMLALLMLWSASRAIESGLTWRRACELSVLGGVAIWCSFSIPFVLAGVGAALAIDVLVKPAASRAALFVVGGVWIASFATYYVMSLAALRGNPELASYWENFFLRPSDLTTSRRIFTTVFIYPLHLVDSRGWIAMPLFAVGCGVLLARQRTRALALMLPILATVFASLLGLYPFFGRLILFAFPMFLLPTLEGVGQLAAWAKRIHPAAGIAAAAMVIAAFSVPSLTIVMRGPQPSSDIRPLVAYLGARAQPDDTLYISELFFEYEYYRRRASMPARPYVQGGYFDREWRPDDDRTLEGLRGQPRVWVLSNSGEPEARLDRIGRRLEESSSPGSQLVLYDLSGR